MKLSSLLFEEAPEEDQVAETERYICFQIPDVLDLKPNSCVVRYDGKNGFGGTVTANDGTDLELDIRIGLADSEVHSTRNSKFGLPAIPFTSTVPDPEDLDPKTPEEQLREAIANGLIIEDDWFAETILPEISELLIDEYYESYGATQTIDDVNSKIIKLMDWIPGTSPSVFFKKKIKNATPYGLTIQGNATTVVVRIDRRDFTNNRVRVEFLGNLKHRLFEIAGDEELILAFAKQIVQNMQPQMEEIQKL